MEISVKMHFKFASSTVSGNTSQEEDEEKRGGLTASPPFLSLLGEVTPSFSSRGVIWWKKLYFCFVSFFFSLELSLRIIYLEWQEHRSHQAHE